LFLKNKKTNKLENTFTDLTWPNSLFHFVFGYCQKAGHCIKHCLSSCPSPPLRELNLNSLLDSLDAKRLVTNVEVACTAPWKIKTKVKKMNVPIEEQISAVLERWYSAGAPPPSAAFSCYCADPQLLDT
jgi:hypothetical protein